MATPLMDPKAALIPWQEAGLTNKSKSWNPMGILTRTMNDISIYLIQKPGYVNNVLLTAVRSLEIVTTNPWIGQFFGFDPEGVWQFNNRLRHVGPNFCLYGCVIVGEHSKAEELILMPQKRGPYIAWGRSMPWKYPQNMLLFLSDQDAGGDGSHESYKAFIQSLINSPAVVSRANGPKAHSIISEFAQHIAKRSKKKGWFGCRPLLGSSTSVFVCKYILHVFLGYEPDQRLATKFAWYYGFYVAWRAIPFGPGGLMFWEKWAREVIANSPLLQSVDFAVAGFDRDYVIDGMMPILCVAALPGPTQYLNYTIPNIPIGSKLGEMDRTQVFRTMMESSRLHPAVGTICTIAQDDFVINIGERMERFPKGTRLCYNIRIAMRDPTVFREPLRFDTDRRNVEENYMVFASVGERHHGRKCPGRRLAENMGTELFMTLGQLGWEPGSIR